MEIFGPRGCIDMGISANSTLAAVMASNRRRTHRNPLLNKVEEEIKQQKDKRVQGEHDKMLWRGKGGNYKNIFVTQETWDQIRGQKVYWNLHKGIWFSFATPKYSVITWLAAKNRLSTGERMIKWNLNTAPGCTFCAEPLETRQHLFFECPYTEQIWKGLVGGIMNAEYTAKWEEILEFITKPATNTTKEFIIRYTFQALLHTMWCERNNRRHGEPHVPGDILAKRLDVMLRNRLSTIRRERVKKYEDGLQTWFATRIP
ncbi:uncharacterized protein LOC112083095 [Eutrema salsugineum]|uniref:uncharacterized protein LOC112083095 n=1 Tax=Eutrema salsugineum TaxID=72664 RepID=UPI000CED7505|nr:uncharacterized protein LOC112083095 [Eutrema salsugineum]